MTGLPKRISRPWTPEEVDLLEEIFIESDNDTLLNRFPSRTLKAIKNKAREMGLKKPVIARESKASAKKEKAPKFTHCDICGEGLPEEEIVMGAANHRECWRSWVEEQKLKNPQVEEEEEFGEI